MELTPDGERQPALLTGESARIAAKLVVAAVLILVLLIFAGSGVDFVYTGF
jgi:hypothetical protein